MLLLDDEIDDRKVSLGRFALSDTRQTCVGLIDLLCNNIARQKDDDDCSCCCCSSWRENLVVEVG